MKELLDRFIKETDMNFSDVKGRFKDIEKKIDDLMAFRWKSFGIFVIVMLAINYAIRLGVFK